ncbi:MAG: hypothetical protein RJB66_624 [Pseudomonadota bacterium]|jgi:RecB family exonuclease
MLELKTYQSLHDKNSFLKSQDFSKTSLIVSDLSTKLFWQDFLLKKNGFIAGPQILRAEDFWKLLLQRSSPDIEIVSKSWLIAYLKKTLTPDFLSQYGLPFTKPASVFNAINELLPILCHPDSNEIMFHWFGEVMNNDCTWESWYRISAALWEDFKKHQVLLSDWASAYLIQSSFHHQFWDRNLIIDLGPEIRTIEVELINTLATKLNICVLTPQPSFMSEFHWIKFPYEDFHLKAHHRSELPQAKRSTPVRLYRRFTSQLAEVKFVVGQLRTWLDQGIALETCAIVAPDIEAYWPVLRWHLKKEGLEFNKKHTIIASTLGSIVAWVSKIKKLSKASLKSEELELADFHPLNHSDAKYLEHRKLWSKRLPPIDIKGDVVSSSIDCNQFIDWAIKFATPELFSNGKIEDLLKRWLIESQSLGLLSLRQWVEYLEDYLGNTEITLDNELDYGLGIYSLMNGIPEERENLIFLGCSESQLKSSAGLLKGAEVLSLKHHTGHLLPHPDRDFREYQLNMLLAHGKEQVFCFPESTFSGAELVPSIFWLNGRELSNEGLNKIDGWRNSAWEQYLLHSESIEQRPVEIATRLPLAFTLSPGSVQNYQKCPFLFLAEKGLRLEDTPIVDLDLNPRTKGSIHHRLIELLVVEPFDAIEIEKNLPDFVDLCLKENDQWFFSESSKRLSKKQLEDFGRRFIAFEAQYRKENKDFYTFAKEAWFKREIEINGQKILFRGKIDRIDISKDHKYAVVIDYKNDLAKLHHFNKWFDFLEFQLLAYTSSVERGFALVSETEPMPPTTVVAAHYMGLKDFSRKGFTLQDIPEGIVSGTTTSASLSPVGKEKLLEEFETLLHDTAIKILNGHFPANPHPTTQCQNCAWRYLCRAQNPNL